MNQQSIPRAVILTALMAFAAVAQEVPTQPTGPQPATQVQVAAGNQEILDLLKAGMSPAVIVAKIKSTQSKFDTTPTALNALKVAGAADEIILAMIEASAAKKEAVTGTTSKRRVTDELTIKFKELQDVRRHRLE